MNLEHLPMGTTIIVDGKEWTKEKYLNLDMFCNNELCVFEESFSNSKKITIKFQKQ